MNSMFDRLGEYLKDYINDDEQGIFSSPEEEKHNENTNNFYQENKSQSEENVDTKTSNKEFKFDTSKQQSEYNKTENKQKHTYKKTEHSKSKPKNTNQTSGKRYYVPFELYEDFKTLCLMPGTNLDECKVAYKSLLKKFHPDKFANEPEKQKEATEITSSITSAFTRIKTWYEENLPKI
ncbi:MAG: J domain-containing protein [Spirochaetaceae bacterium]|nr:J domain-containing protein [Spirochaetaceae bacterium]